jgi:predicted TIM-barrel fold metal-dependent hydrolase
MKRIDLEAHFYMESYLRALSVHNGFPRLDRAADGKGGQFWFTSDTGQPFVGDLIEALLDAGEKRIRTMDELGIDIQVLSLSSPGVEQLDPDAGMAVAKEANDFLAQTIRQHGGRFMGFAALAPKDPVAAADELERCAKELGFKGWNTHSNYGDSYLDDEQYRPILARAAQLNMPIYIHPTVPAVPQVRKYGFSLAGSPFGFGFEVGLCAMRLILSGVFDEYPSLKIILGHLGEALPFTLKRMDGPSKKKRMNTLEKKPSEYFRNNFFVTTSGNCYKPAFQCTYEALGIDRILFATDYPYEDPAECIEFLEQLSISEREKEKIYYLNAKELGITV